MGSYVFQWPQPANEVYVTGSFDNWTQRVKLDKSDDTFRKEVELAKVDEKIRYKFIVDGNWKLDQSALQEPDEHSNVNNVLLPEDIKKIDKPAAAQTEGPVTTEMSGVTPESTTAALAAGVPKQAEEAPETSKSPEPGTEDGPVFATISSVAPDSTTAELAKDVPFEHPRPPPGTFPETPAKEQEQFSVSPIPATPGIGNPIQLKPGETVPDPGNLTENTVTSTVTTDKAGYEKDASAPGISPPAPDSVPEPSATAPAPTIQSVAPTSTTAVLAGAVPLEGPSDVKSSVPETPAQDVPQVVKESIEKSNTEPEAAGNEEAVEQKKEVEEELVKEVKTVEPAGEPAPTTTAETMETAPAPAPSAKKEHVRDLSPKSKEPATAPEGATAATGAGEAAAPAAPPEDAPTADKKKKKKNRVSGFFQKVKEKFK